ncbi:MAG: undecaprenyldiphospho-muramoylpentapeptide beta-N-acetylglucosaminyltransferase [Clostridia bacterium]|nr:undecaprenyldiphospho-muramoylpentapeptide beta-N-acetylglucosaminyltransferase [Clostridia bacterium]
MKIFIAGGGTAGHINPALTIADLLVSDLAVKKGDITFIGTKRGFEKDLVPRAGYAIEFITVRGFRRKISFNTIQGILSLMLGMIQARHLIKKEKPDLVIGTGGYVSGPVLYYASRFKIPTLIHEQNALPGVTSKILAKRVDACAISFEESRKYFTECKKVVLTGNPLRDDILSSDRKQCRQNLGIKDNEKLVVVMGGSLGALAINNAMTDLINNEFKDHDFRLIFAPGKKYYEDVKGKIFNNYDGIEIKDYIYNAPEVYHAADLIIARGGAMTISEMMAIGIPSILIPSANVAENHQENNARAIEKAGACKVILDKDLNGKVLYDIMMTLLLDETKLSDMRSNAYEIGIRDAKKRIADMLREMIKVS